MSKIIKIIIVILLPVLTGCHEKHTYSYYMQHPEVLKKAVATCQSSRLLSKEQVAQCEVILYSATNMISLINEQQADPEAFGQRIMDAQAAYIKLKDEVRKAQVSLDVLKKDKQASTSDVRAAQDDWYKAKKACAEQFQEVKVLLAVVGLGKPD
ncbi:MAG: EexN family lipoprotein [Gammaproteobacteria bacterium]|nr:EexN family lipoprotein [Gammaproteobacteria bacterium]MCW5582661.1 EexN family lipoprotein [Gammaproteobacteria bacterium]